MLRVAALSSGHLVPSARFRIRQHINPLRELGIEVTEFTPRIEKYGPAPGWPKRWNPWLGLPLNGPWQVVKLGTRIPGILGSYKNEVTWLERQFLDGLFTLEGCLRHPLVLDVDDAIWLRPPLGRSAARALAGRADVVVAGNQYLADWFGSRARSVQIVPTAVDTEVYRPAPARERANPSRFVVGWVGGSWNLGYLEAIEKPLRRFMDRFADTELVVVADRPPGRRFLPGRRVRHVPWSEAAEAPSVQQIDVGLMPLPDTEWARGKCSLKMLEYMSCGAAVVVSPVGMNAEILAMDRLGVGATTDDEWYEALEHLYLDRNCASEFGKAGRAVAQRFFDTRIICAKLANIFQALV